MKTPAWLRIQNAAATDEGPAIVYLYGLIGEDWWGDGNAAIDFAKALDELSPRDIELRVNSEGGSVFEGYAMYSALNRYAGNVTAHVDGLAASAASYLILAADEVVVAEASFMMIHNAWGGGYFIGNADELDELVTEYSARLRMLDSQIADIYDKHSEKTRDEIVAAMAATTWLTADQTVEWGFASRVDEGVKAAACISPKAAEMFGKVPDGITIADQELDQGVVIAPSDAVDTITEETTAVEADAVQEPEQELVVDKAQERPVRTIGETMSLSYRMAPSGRE